MQAAAICFIFWIMAICSETFLFSALKWFNPNLFFLFPCLLSLRWRGRENIFIAVFFGLTSDCFSTLPFGIYGLSYMIFTVFIRWYAIRIYQNDMATLPIIVGVFTLAANFLTFVLMSVFFNTRSLSWQWMQNIVLYRVISAVILSIPSYRLLLIMENKFRVHLAERKF